jgi:fibro-slime domain-containing protein
VIASPPMRDTRLHAWLPLAALLLAGCGARSQLIVCERGQTRPCESFCGVGVQTCVQGEWTPCSTSPPESEVSIPTTIRDFRADHPDFESETIGLDIGIVEGQIGEDGKPVYAGSPTTPTTNGQASFDQWFRDVPGVNQSTTFPITLVSNGQEPPVYSFDSPNFFPIDGQLQGDEGLDHNYHFTLEMVVDFRYSGGETFTFRGDDDVFAFINGHLAIDLGGVHSAEAASVDLDAVAEPFGLTPGEAYSLALFFCERHSTGSSFYVETTIAEFEVCPE